MNSYGCVHDCSDEDCRMCSVHGYLLNGCPYDCEDYEDMHGNAGVLCEVVFGKGED